MSRIRRKNHFNDSRVLEKLIFDFYVLESLSYFAGKNSLNFSDKSRAIENQLEIVVEKLYINAREALEKSIYKEYKHSFGWYSGNKTRQKIFSSSSTRKLKKAFIVFSDYKKWCDEYGGKLWANAAELALQYPQSTKDKVLWLDRLFDMQHNTGHLLNKTDFKVLERKRAAFGKVLNQKPNPIKMLNFRYKANLKQLSCFSSKKVKGLLFANKNRIPKALFGD